MSTASAAPRRLSVTAAPLAKDAGDAERTKRARVLRPLDYALDYIAGGDGDVTEIMKTFAGGARHSAAVAKALGDADFAAEAETVAEAADVVRAHLQRHQDDLSALLQGKGRVEISEADTTADDALIPDDASESESEDEDEDEAEAEGE